MCINTQFLGPFPTQLTDPPWPEHGGGKIKRGADRHYPLIRKNKDIAGVMMDSPLWNPASDAHLWIWVTNTYLPWGIELFGLLGFKYKTNFPWVKSGRMGLGQYGRGCHEILLFGVRGKGYNVCRLNEKGNRATVRTDAIVGVSRVIDPVTKKMIHSAKPPESYDLIESRSIGPYAEFFARGSAHNEQWSVMGNEAE